MIIDIIFLLIILVLVYLELVISSLISQVITFIFLIIVLCYMKKFKESSYKVLGRLITVYMIISYISFVFFISECVKFYVYIKNDHLFSFRNIVAIVFFLLSHLSNCFFFNLEFIFVQKIIKKISNQQTQLELDILGSKSNNSNADSNHIEKNENNRGQPSFKKEDVVVVVEEEKKQNKETKRKEEDKKEKESEESDVIGYNKNYRITNNEVVILSTNREILDKNSRKEKSNREKDKVSDI